MHREVLAGPGIRFTAAGPHDDPAAIAETAARATEITDPMEQVAVLRDFHLAAGDAHYRVLHDVLAGHDLVVLHAIHALAHAAVLDLKLLWASVVFDPVLLPTTSAPPAGMPSLGPANRLGWWMLDRMLRRKSGPLDELLARAGSRQRRLPLFRARSSHLHIVACSPALISVPPDLAHSTHVTGAWTDPRPPQPLSGVLQAFLAGEPPVVITLGSMAGIDPPELSAAIGAATSAGMRIVLQDSGALASDDAPGLLRAGEADHRALFAGASAVVHHGGAGTTHAACAAGVPSVVVPHVGDQRYWAERLEQLGVAPPAIPARQLTGAALLTAMRVAASDTVMRERAAELGAQLRTERGLDRAIELIEACVS